MLFPSVHDKIVKLYLPLHVRRVFVTVLLALLATKYAPNAGAQCVRRGRRVAASGR